MRTEPLPIAAAAIAVLIQGCASPGRPVTQTVQVETPGCLRVSCELSNDHGRWPLQRTPGSVTLTTSKAPLQVSCRADDGAGGSAGAPSSLRPMTHAGMLAGGAVGAGIGAAAAAPAMVFIPPLGVVIVLAGVAAGMGAGQAVESGQRGLRYPDVISIPMNCDPIAAASEPGVRAPTPLGLNIRGLPQAQAGEPGLGDRARVLVTAVQAGGRAAAAGLRSGDLILAANGEPLGDAADLEERVARSAAGSLLALRIWREGKVLEVIIERSAQPP